MAKKSECSTQRHGLIKFWNWKFWSTNGFHYWLFHVSVKPICINAQARFNWCVYFLQLVHFNEYCINVELLRMSILNTIRLRYVIGGATCTAIGGQQSGKLETLSHYMRSLWDRHEINLVRSPWHQTGEITMTSDSWYHNYEITMRSPWCHIADIMGWDWHDIMLTSALCRIMTG